MSQETPETTAETGGEVDLSPSAPAAPPAQPEPAATPSAQQGVDTPEPHGSRQTNRARDVHAAAMLMGHGNIYVGDGGASALRTFSCGSGAWPVSPQDEAEARSRFGGMEDEVEGLLAHLDQHRVLVLSADYPVHAATAATYLGARLRSRHELTRETLIAGQLDRHVRLDLRELTHRDDDFRGRLLVFRNPFSGRGDELRRVLEQETRSDWTALGNRLHEINAFLVFTTGTVESQTLPGGLQPFLQALRQHSPECLEEWLERQLSGLVGRDEVVAALRTAGVPQRFHYVSHLADFVDFFVGLGRPELGIDTALAHFFDTTESLRQDPDGDLDGWAFGFTLAMAQCARDAGGVAWVDFHRLYQHVRRWLRRDLQPIHPRATDPGPEARPELSDDSLLNRCRAEVEKDPVTLADVIRFRGGPPMGLWETMLSRHRRMLTAFLPRLQALIEHRKGDVESHSMRILAAQIIGRAGEIDPGRIVAPLLERWVESADWRQQASVGPLFQGLLGSAHEGYRRSCLGYLRRLHESTSGETDPPTVQTGDGHEPARRLKATANEKLRTVIAAYSWVGDYELQEAMDQLGRIAETHLLPVVADVQRLERLINTVEEAFRQQDSPVQGALLLSVHEFLGEFLGRVYGEHGGTITMFQHTLESLFLGTDPSHVFAQMVSWLNASRGKMDVLLGLVFLNESGLAARFSRAAPGGATANGRSRNPIVMSIVRGNAGSRQRELAQAVLFLDTVFQSLSATFTGDRKLCRYCMEALMQHLTAWVRASLDNPDQRTAMLSLLQALSTCESGVFRQPISGLLVSPAFSRPNRRMEDFARDTALLVTMG
jgi:hypothetical protein